MEPYTYSAERYTYSWVKRYVLFHGKRHPLEMGAAEITSFLTALAVERRVSAATQNQALAALLFLYRDVLGRDPGWLEGVIRARRPKRLPVVVTRSEVQQLFAALGGASWLMAALLYGSGLRLIECLRLRVKDVDFSRHEILVREGKGAKDRVTMLPQAAAQPLAAHLERVRALHARDCAAGFGTVLLPDALESKYPSAAKDWAWQWIFPAAKLSIDPRSGVRRRHHLHESVLQKGVRAAARRAGLIKLIGPHTLRHASPPTCWKAAMTSAPSRNCSATTTSPPP